MAKNNYQWYSEQSTPQRLSSMRDDEITILSRQVAMLNERMDFLSAQASQILEEMLFTRDGYDSICVNNVNIC